MVVERGSGRGTPSFGWRDHGAKMAAGVLAVVLGVGVTWAGRIPPGEDAFDTWAIILIAFVGGVVLFVYGFREYRRRSLVANTPTSKVRSLAVGVVEVEGDAKAVEEALKAPLSGNDCVLYEYEIEEYRSSGDDSDWVTIDSGKKEQPFYIDDGTGEVVVDPSGADLRLPRDERYRVGSFDELPDTAQGFVRDNPDVDTQTDEWFEEDRRYTERQIAAGQTVYVFGKALPRVGHSSATNPDNAVINTDRNTPMFVISDRSESEVMSSMTKRVLGAVLGGFVLAVGGFAALLFFVGFL